jgi:energy-coupling factor transport system permease protein
MAEILQYVHKDGFFHRLNPFTKIAFVMVISLMCIIATSLPFLMVMVISLFIISRSSDLYSDVIQQSRLIIMMSIVFVIITLLTMPNGAIIGYLFPSFVPVIGGSFPMTLGALEIGLILSLRFMVLIVAFQLFLISTQPRDLVHTMERMKIPID